jgi:hypothetical protein
VTKLNDASAVRLGAAVASRVYAGPTLAWPPRPTYRSTILATPNLVGYWRLAEPSGAAAADETGVNPAAYHGTVTRGVAGATPDGNAGIRLDGNAANYVMTLGALLGDFVDRPRPVPALGNLDVGDVVTLEAWVNLNGSRPGGGGRGILSKGSGAFYMRMDGASGALQFLKSQQANIVTSTANVPVSGWHHVVATKSGAAVHLYLDKADVTGAVSNATLASSGQPVTIGGDTFGAGVSEPWLGSLDEAAIYARALTPAEVKAHWDAAQP